MRPKPGTSSPYKVKKIDYPMRTAVPATVPPSRLCTKFVTPILGTIREYPFTLPQFLHDFLSFVSPKMLLKSTPGGLPEPFWASPGEGERKGAILSDFCAKNSPVWEAFGAQVWLFFCSGLRGTTKGCLRRPSKIVPFFCRFGDLPGGPQEGSRLHGSSIFTFVTGPKKGSKMGAKMDRFGPPNPNYTNFGPPFGRNWGPKSCIRNVVVF